MGPIKEEVMSLKIESTGAVCGAVVTGIDLKEDLSPDLVAELRQHWVENKLLIFPDQPITDADLERVTLYFGEFGEDPFFGHIEGHENWRLFPGGNKCLSDSILGVRPCKGWARRSFPTTLSASECDRQARSRVIWFGKRFKPLNF